MRANERSSLRPPCEYYYIFLLQRRAKIFLRIGSGQNMRILIGRYIELNPITSTMPFIHQTIQTFILISYFDNKNILKAYFLLWLFKIFTSLKTLTIIWHLTRIVVAFSWNMASMKKKKRTECTGRQILPVLCVHFECTLCVRFRLNFLLRKWSISCLFSFYSDMFIIIVSFLAQLMRNFHDLLITLFFHFWCICDVQLEAG